MKNKFKVGDLYRIPLSEVGYAFCVACIDNEFAFFDFFSKSAKTPPNLFGMPLAFRIYVGKGEPKNANWEFIENIKMKYFLTEQSRFLHKPVGTEECFIYYKGVSTRAIKSDVKELELFMVWTGEAIKKRLNEYFQGKPSSDVLALKEYLDIDF